MSDGGGLLGLKGHGGQGDVGLLQSMSGTTVNPALSLFVVGGSCTCNHIIVCFTMRSIPYERFWVGITCELSCEQA